MGEKKIIISSSCQTILPTNISFKEWIVRNLPKNNENPFRVVVLGQSGVGKSTTVNVVFGIDNYVCGFADGTTEIVEKVFPMRNGFNLSIYDRLNNDIDKDFEYEEICKKILPGCDIIAYVIDAHSKDLHEDCRILKEIVLPICNTNNLRDNLILAFNKIDIIGETENPYDPELRWNITNNCPTEKLKKAIKNKIFDIVDYLLKEHIVGCTSPIQAKQVVFYSAIYNYNLGDFLRAITKNRDPWTSVIGLERIGKYIDKSF